MPERKSPEQLDEVRGTERFNTGHRLTLHGDHRKADGEGFGARQGEPGDPR